MNTDPSDNSKSGLRMILKFDTGADGFMKMIYVLAFSSVALTGIGIYFLLFYFRGVQH